MCKGTPDIKVITGIRRCGKSKLLDSFEEKITQNEANSNVIKINFNLNEFDGIKKGNDLIKFVNERYKKDVPNYLFIDEVQLCEGFEKAINSFYAEEKYDIYITGSNAFFVKFGPSNFICRKNTSNTSISFFLLQNLSNIFLLRNQYTIR